MKGQVTLFIILGIIVAAAFIGVFVFKDYILKSEFERESAKIGVAEEFTPLYESYMGCVEEIADDGIIILASQGGYINIPKYEYLVNPFIPFSNKLDVFGDEAIEVAYWFYETGTGIQTQKIPSLEEMQNELNEYIEDNLHICTLNFTGYSGYTINDFENFDINTQINDGKIFVEILSDFNVDYKGVNQEFDDVKVVVGSSLGYVYSKAVELYSKQMEENYFEEKTIDYLVVYDDIPYSGTHLDCNPRVWNKQNVEKDFKEILEVNTEAVANVNEKYYNFDLGDNNLGVNFMYIKDWPFFMEINGGEEVLKEESAFGDSQAAEFLSALFCLSDYRFIYDIKYPILATVSKNGLDFQFAFEVIIDNNQPKYNLLGSDLIELDDSICDAKNVPFIFYISDYENYESLNDVDVKFSCLGSSCDLGETESDGFGDYGLDTYVPPCINANIKTYKEGYHTGSLTLNTNEEGIGYLYMKPTHSLDLRIKIIENGNIREPYDDENVFINFIDEEDGFNYFLQGGSVDLVMGDYIIRSYIMKKSNKPLTIKGETVKHCSNIPKGGVLGVLGFTEKKCFETELEDVEMEQVLVGGNEFSWSYEGSGTQITVYVNYDGVPNTITEMNSNYEKLFNQNRVRYPELI